MLKLAFFSAFWLKAEGIFRINAENSQEETVRSQLNRGIVPYGIDVHCLAGLIKVSFNICILHPSLFVAAFFKLKLTTSIDASKILKL